MTSPGLQPGNPQEGWLQKPLRQLSRRTLRTAHPHWSDSEVNQALMMLDLRQENPCGDLGVILA